MESPSPSLLSLQGSPNTPISSSLYTSVTLARDPTTILLLPLLQVPSQSDL